MGLIANKSADYLTILRKGSFKEKQYNNQLNLIWASRVTSLIEIFD